MKRSFTMVELVVVIAIISLIAAFGSPNFIKAIKRARARDAMNNLAIIHAAESLYKSNVSYFLKLDTIGDINLNLGLKLVASDGTTYQCNDATPPTNCVATAGTGAADFQGTIDITNPMANPSCSGSSCP